MPMDYSGYIPEEIKETRQEAGRLGAEAAATGAGQYTFPYQLREALRKKLDYHKDIIEQQAGAQAEYFATPAKARAKYVKAPEEEGYITPIQAERLVAQERAQAYAPYASLTDILGQRMGTVSELVGAGTGAYQAQVAAAQGAAQQAQQLYQQLMSEYQMGAGIQQQQFQQQMQQEQEARAMEQLQMLRDAAQREAEQTAWAQEQAAWERPWQERLWEYQLAAPYFAPPTGGGGGGIEYPTLEEEDFSDLEADWNALNVPEDTETGSSSAAPQSVWSGLNQWWNK